MIQKACFEDAPTLAALALKLWPDNDAPVLEEEMRNLLERQDCGLFLLRESGQPVGFAQCQLRRDYVEGTATSPVGYLEGVFVEEHCRRRGYARALLAACQDWARRQGCREFASDCELDNRESLAFHLAMGFQEANRIICFTREL